MPWSIKKQSNKFCVVKEGETSPVPGGCHSDRKSAVAHLQALYASEPKIAAASTEVFEIDDMGYPTRDNMDTQNYTPNPALPPRHVEVLGTIAQKLKDLADYIILESFVPTGIPTTDQAPPVETPGPPKAIGEMASTLNMLSSELLAAAGKVEEFAWEGPIAFEGVSTGDNRYFRPGSIEWDDSSFPVPFRWQRSSVGGHAGAVSIGRVDHLERKPDGVIYGYGVVIPSLNEEAAEYLRLLESGVASGVSIDGDSAVFDVSETENGQTKMEFTTLRIRSLTAVDIPAFSNAHVDLTAAGEDLEEFEVNKKRKKDMRWVYSMTASAGAPVKPPLHWFENPLLEGPTPITVTPQGEIFGHLALFDTCHIGFPGACVSPPKNGSYRYFHTGELETEKGDLVEVGHLTFNTGHANMKDSAKAAAAHYDHTGTVAADVRVGEDEFGIWVAGALRSHLGNEEVRAFRAAPLSGDWRRIAGKLELVGALAVNVPGFPVPRVRTLVAAGQTETLFIFQEAEVVARRYKKIELAQRLGLVPVETLVACACDDDEDEDDMYSFTLIVDDVSATPSAELVNAYLNIINAASDAYADYDVDIDVDIDVDTAKSDEPAESYTYSLKIDLDGLSQTPPDGVQAACDAFKAAVTAIYGSNFDLDVDLDVDTPDEEEILVDDSSDQPSDYSESEPVMYNAEDVMEFADKVTKAEAGGNFPASDYAYVPDPQKSSTWKLRLTSTPGGKPDPGIVGAAAAALGSGGFRGQKVQIPSADLAKVKARVRAAWHEANPDKKDSEMPKSLVAAGVEIKKTDGGKQFPSSDYAYVPDPHKPSTWKLRLTSTPGGTPDPGIVGAAAAALSPGGFRGNQVQIPAADLPKVKAKIRTAWHEANPDKKDSEMPESIK